MDIPHPLVQYTSLQQILAQLQSVEPPSGADCAANLREAARIARQLGCAQLASECDVIAVQLAGDGAIATEASRLVEAVNVATYLIHECFSRYPTIGKMLVEADMSADGDSASQSGGTRRRRECAKRARIALAAAKLELGKSISIEKAWEFARKHPERFGRIPPSPGSFGRYQRRLDGQ